jgi:hypothetical protein
MSCSISRCTIILATTAAFFLPLSVTANTMPHFTIESMVSGPAALHQGGGPLPVIFGFQGVPGNRELSEKNWQQGVYVNELGKSQQVKQEYQQALTELGLQRMVMNGMQVRMIQNGPHQIEGSANAPTLILPAELQSRPAGTKQPWKGIGRYTVQLRYVGKVFAAGMSPAPHLAGIQVTRR